eukprot:8504940-Pyramimonas_sp.AAC.1
MDVEEIEPRRARRRGVRRAPRGQHTDKQWTNKDQNMQMLLTSLMTLTLQNTQKIRMIMCTVADTWTVPINLPTVSHISTELEGFKTR